MKIAIIGTRGIPNHYGGFEQFAEVLSQELVKNGILVSTYCPHNHYYKEKIWNGVMLIHKFCPHFLGSSLSQFVYDLLCIIDSNKRNFDIVYHLGYTSSAIWFGLHKKNTRIVTNMDGIEWQRKKYKHTGKMFLKYAENKAIKMSHCLIADSEEIKKYLVKKFSVEVKYLSYPASVTESFTSSDGLPLPFEPQKYYLSICRLEPENNVEMIIEAYNNSQVIEPLIIIGNNNTKYGKFLMRKYCSSNVIFYGSLYDKIKLDKIRYHSKLYLHGHSVGGTNPSLLEAMAAKALICAHDNPFNREVLGENAFFYKCSMDLTNLLHLITEKSDYQTMIFQNFTLIKQKYQPEYICKEYLSLFTKIANTKS